MKVPYEQAAPFVTKDGSIVRELIHPRRGYAAGQSLAAATVPPGSRTALHIHLRSEEIYHVTRGRGTMVLGEESFGIAPGDSVLIPPGMPHRLVQSGGEELVVLCCCSPPYSDDDTELLREEEE
ncbi:MAG: cupin domain-containing protein [Desulfomonilia bacterium]|jgi:mannose-6-phosphate isomerase-like protein (cupin superfamily)